MVVLPSDQMMWTAWYSYNRWSSFHQIRWCGRLDIPTIDGRTLVLIYNRKWKETRHPCPQRVGLHITIRLSPLSLRRTFVVNVQHWFIRDLHKFIGLNPYCMKYFILVALIIGLQIYSWLQSKCWRWVSERWFNAVSATEAIFAARTLLFSAPRPGIGRAVCLFATIPKNASWDAPSIAQQCLTPC